MHIYIVSALYPLIKIFGKVQAAKMNVSCSLKFTCNCNFVLFLKFISKIISDFAKNKGEKFLNVLNSIL